MKTPLKLWLDARRGRQTELSGAIDLSAGYLSQIASGQKVPSADVAQRIAAATGLRVTDIIADPGLREDAAEPFTPGPAGNRIGALAATVAPHLRHRQFWRATANAPELAVLEGDILVIEAQFDPQAIRPGEQVLARATDSNGEAQTILGVSARPWIMRCGGRTPIVEGRDAAVLGLIRAVLRGEGLAPDVVPQLPPPD